MHRYKRAITLIRRDPLHSDLHLRFRCFIRELAHQPGKRRRIIHLGDANRKTEELFVSQNGTRSEGGQKIKTSAIMWRLTQVRRR